ncbi:hypothetical protein [Burkholderia sp. LMG 21824]|uniref:hypothetical protein n=1 Tax=Burkholderia sp. LMG 21824 TaxID=3158172 RepID=UPI003C2D2F20
MANPLPVGRLVRMRGRHVQRDAGDDSADAAVARECAKHVRMVGGNAAPICSNLSIFVGAAGGGRPWLPWYELPHAQRLLDATNVTVA